MNNNSKFQSSKLISMPPTHIIEFGTPRSQTPLTRTSHKPLTISKSHCPKIESTTLLTVSHFSPVANVSNCPPKYATHLLSNGLTLCWVIGPVLSKVPQTQAYFSLSLRQCRLRACDDDDDDVLRGRGPESEVGAAILRLSAVRTKFKTMKLNL